MLEIDRAQVVRSVADVRTWQDTATRDAVPVTRASDLGSGRLLVYFPDAELSDGAAEAETNGFFDVENAPPWDTWVALFQDDPSDLSYGTYLVSWVPGELVESVSRGIWVNPEECIVWLQDSKTRAAASLRSSGLLE
jgi:hypothetical protein